MMTILYYNRERERERVILRVFTVKEGFSKILSQKKIFKKF